MKHPKAALFYYDSYRLIERLSDEQLGVLFRALMDYGLLLLRGQKTDLEVFRRRYPNMEDVTCGFFAFMADTLRRDTDTYREKCAHYSAAAQKREAEKAHARETRDSGSAAYVPRPAPKPKPDPAWDYVP